MGRLAAAALLLGLAPGPGSAHAREDGITVEARVDAERIGEGDSLTLTVEVRGAAPGQIEDPDLSGLADFSIAAGPSLSTSTSMIWQGGQAATSTSRQFSYVLLPRRRGSLTIPSISIRLGSKIRQTNPITIEVVEGRVRRPGPGARRGAPAPGGRGASQEPAAGELLVESAADKREVFVGEQILLTYKVYTQLELVEVPSPRQLPSYTGFWVEEIPTDPRGTIRRMQRGGAEFVEITLMKKVLFPTVSGTLTIEETVFALPVRAQSRDPFDSIFFTPTRMVYRRTAPITIRVKPLPEQGRPESFSGAVGRYEIQVSVDRSETRVNDAVGLSVKVSGEGNIRVVGEPLLPPLPDYKRYEPKVEESREIVKDRVRGEKTWEYVLTPLAPGRQDIPPVRFGWFDPIEAAYREVASPVQAIVVQRGAPGTEAPGDPALRREVTAFGRDVRYIKPASELARRGGPYHRSWTFATLLVAPLLANGALLFAVRRRERHAADAGLLRGRRAPAFARRRLRQARRLMSQGRTAEVHQEVARAVLGYLSDKLDASASGLTHATIERLLAERGVEQKLRSDLIGCLEACDYARFAPSSAGAADLKAAIESSERIIARLEGALSGRRGARGAA